MAHIWFHTSFIENNELKLNKKEIDQVWKDKHNKKFQ